MPSDHTAGNPSERRRETRYGVELHGELRCDGACFAVQIADISGSGALVLMKDPPEAGRQAELWIQDFGTLPIKIVHAGGHFCGVSIVAPTQYRDRLLNWLRQEIASGGPAAAVR
jgi:hypothetical protein